MLLNSSPDRFTTPLALHKSYYFTLIILTEGKSLTPPNLGDMVKKWDIMAVLFCIFLITGMVEHC